MRRGLLPGAHFIKQDVCSRFSGLKSCFATGQAGAYYNNPFHFFILETESQARVDAAGNQGQNVPGLGAVLK